MRIASLVFAAFSRGVEPRPVVLFILFFLGFRVLRCFLGLTLFNRLLKFGVFSVLFAETEAMGLEASRRFLRGSGRENAEDRDRSR